MTKRKQGDSDGGKVGDLAKAKAELLKAKYGARGGETSERATWEGVESAPVMNLVEAVTDRGGAVILGISKQGDMCSVTILLYGEKFPFWFRGNEVGQYEFYEWSGDFINDLEA